MVRARPQAKRFDRGRAAFTSWLYRIVVNLCIDERRRTQPEPMSDKFDGPDQDAPPDEMMVAAERRRDSRWRFWRCRSDSRRR
jgi:RNA polymerase sigma-70 factor (ECF subfamily)